MQRALQELECSTVTDGHLMYLMLFVYPVLLQLINCLKGQIKLKKINMEEATMAMFCRMMGIMPMSHAAGLLMSNTVRILQKNNFTKPEPVALSWVLSLLTCCHSSLR